MRKVAGTDRGVEGGSRGLWDRFWGRDRDIRKVYSNEGRVYRNLSKVVDIKGKCVLEIGGGSGRDSLEMAEAGANNLILDYTLTPLLLVKSQVTADLKPPSLICGDALALPIKDRVIDVVFHQGLMEHFRDPSLLLEENRRVLRSGGILLVDVPQLYHPYTLLKMAMIRLNRWFAGWETQYSIRELEHLVRRHRFDPVLAYGDWMAPSMFYRLCREVLFSVGIEVPLYPRGPFPAIHRARTRVKCWLREKRPLFYTFHVIGVIGRKLDR